MYYNDYLQLDKILSSQNPESDAQNEPAHDEMLFIIIHQAYELWFKQILFELDYVNKVFGEQRINDNSEELNLVRHRLRRIATILQLLNQQVSILDTMTPLDFLEFRNVLIPSSGFQSVQFRLIEARLGLQMQMRHQYDHYKHTNAGGFNTDDLVKVSNAEEEKSLLQQINNWLERMPFFREDLWSDYKSLYENEKDFHLFWNDYYHLFTESLLEREKQKAAEFNYVFFDISESITNAENLRTSLSAAAMRSALFIMLYRDFPVFQTAYQILDSLIEIDNLLGNWRHKHLSMVRRMIGMRVGTGNTSGAGYLEGALNRHYIYKDIAALSTYLIERRKLPRLPEKLIQHLSFYGTEY